MTAPQHSQGDQCLESLDNLPRTCHQEQQGAVLLLLTATACCASLSGSLCHSWVPSAPLPTLCPELSGISQAGENLGRPAPQNRADTSRRLWPPTHALPKSNPALLVLASDGAFLESRGGPGPGTSLIPRPSFEGRSLSGKGQLES